MMNIKDIISNYQSYSSATSEEIERLQNTYSFSTHLHTQSSLTGNSYIQYILEICFVITKMRLDSLCIHSALLIGILKYELASIEEIKNLCGEKTADICIGITQIDKITENSSLEENIAENMRQMMFATSKDIRVILVKLVERLVQIRYLNQLQKDQQEKIAKESLNIYAPIAHRLGLYQIKNEFENISFKQLLPKQYLEVDKFCRKNKEQRQIFIQKINSNIQNLLEENEISGELQERTKHYYSIYKKAIKKDIEYTHVYDLIAFRILVSNQTDCYKVLGFIHSQYQPIMERFKDYIAMPKANGYQSLHTTLMDRQGFIFEVQIRTYKMHNIAENGIAAHWNYKEGQKKDGNADENVRWLRGLTEDLLGMLDSKESLEMFHQKIYADSVYVFTPKGKIIKLPIGATAIDFAYHIHTEIGLHCKAAKIDGQMVPIRTTLENGNLIEIITSSQQYPNSSWLKAAVTSKALSKIRSYLREQEEIKAEKIGLEIFTRELKKVSQKIRIFEKSERFKEFLTKASYLSLKEYLIALGFGHENISSMLNFCELKAPIIQKLRSRISNVFPTKTEKPRIIGVEGIPIRIANCCKPIQGDPIIGISSSGKWISVHHQFCKKVEPSKTNTNQFVQLQWEIPISEQTPVTLQLEFMDNIKMSSKIMKILASAKITLMESHSNTKGKMTKQNIVIQGNHKLIKKVIHKLSHIKNITLTQL